MKTGKSYIILSGNIYFKEHLSVIQAIHLLSEPTYVCTYSKHGIYLKKVGIFSIFFFRDQRSDILILLIPPLFQSQMIINDKHTKMIACKIGVQSIDCIRVIALAKEYFE